MVYEYNAALERVIDGDTIVVRVNLGYRMTIQQERVRLLGVDTAELRPRSGPQYDTAVDHRTFTERWLADAATEFAQQVAEGAITEATAWPLTLNSHEIQRDNFARTLGSISRRSDDTDLSAALLDQYGDSVLYTR